MPYVPKLLSRITSGEIGRDQAVIDYFYYDPSITIEEVMSPGFFDGAGYLFYKAFNAQTYQRISIVAQVGSPNVNPGFPHKYQAVVSDVEVISAAGEPPSKFKVTASLGSETYQQVDDPGISPPSGPSWHSFFIKYRGIVRMQFNLPLSVAIMPSDYAYDVNDFSTAILMDDQGNQHPPEAADAIITSYMSAGPSNDFPLQLNVRTHGGTNPGFSQRVFVTVYSQICKFV